MTTTAAVAREAGRARGPLLAAAAVLLLVVAAAPWADRTLPVAPGLTPAYLATLLTCDVLTAVLLVGRFRGGASPRLVVLAAGFGWSAVMVVGLALAAPGLLSRTAVVDDPDALWWLWLSRHVVPTALLAGALVPWPTSWRFGADLDDAHGDPGPDDPRPHRRLDRRLVGATVLVGGAVVAGAALAGGALPTVSTPSGASGVGSRLTDGWAVAVVVVGLLTLAAAGTGVALRRSRSALEAWTVVTVLAGVGEGLLTVLSPTDHTVGALAARVLALAAGLMVLVFMLRDVFALHRRATDDAVRLQRQNGELLDAGRLRDHLVAVVSQEMRTPLAGLQGYLELLSSEDDLDDRTEGRMLERSWLLTRRLTLLSEDLLAVASVEQGDFVLIPETVRLAHQLDECAACFPDLDLRLVCPSDLMVYADTLRLQQVLTNLVRNAQRHGAEPVTVTCAAVGDATGAHVVIRVADSGAGVPGDFVHRLFERYARGGAQRGGGSGLGLSVVRDLVRAHGGSVRYDLTDPAFVVTLPHPTEPHPTRRTASHRPVTPRAEPAAPTSALEAFTLLSAAGPATGEPGQPIENALSLTAKK